MALSVITGDVKADAPPLVAVRICPVSAVVSFMDVAHAVPEVHRGMPTVLGQIMPAQATTKESVATSVELSQVGVVDCFVAVVVLGKLVAKDHVPLLTCGMPVAAWES